MKENQIIGELVAKDYRTASVFKKYSIDFCCQGNRTIQEACDKKNIDSKKVLEDLDTLVQTKSEATTDYQSWPLDLLADYIEKKHHRYVQDKTLEIQPYLDKICRVHGEHHPELFEIKNEFNASAGELAAHMKKEELILFPFIRKMVKVKQENSNVEAANFGTVKNPIQMMMDEHTVEGNRFRRIEELSNNYTPPQDACNTYRVSFALLKEFEQDLHLHIHLENNILFPKAVEIENDLI
ncbi:iron-sulfur cluster repair di-iron protein [Flavobacterium sp.]|jgi:regulator of cell morphogenesis and NO signaling|uniref:iron-sulfur cluster repair di-iron protein n=1 Tax=Flavobacterium sp. TaxID=239 RepID=UPI001B51A9D5|nr:iron-sulfur cluster repair di-iron protein [Flavobacterium sp.]MBK7041564.1 iron-sulfur cluster repair di-iron protein [Bacteroidota bacterium]MBP6128710.1 iron-sulfur cluster repair di-iron protein [Flavobacterium sp.]HQV36980.1 iron-sulfur cluster repair di-iron protein [Flavobacterium sp.]HRI33596.1 iron-sulfur cluster repair di-iron protein [Saprospiraceae bacterium]